MSFSSTRGETWVVSLGDNLGLKSVDENPTPRDAVVSTLASAAELPDRWLGYSGVDFLVIPTSDTSLLSNISKRQSEAIVRWVNMGGRVVLLLGESSPKAFDSAPWLSALLPFRRGRATSCRVGSNAVGKHLRKHSRRWAHFFH